VATTPDSAPPPGKRILFAEFWAVVFVMGLTHEPVRYVLVALALCAAIGCVLLAPRVNRTVLTRPLAIFVRQCRRIMILLVAGWIVVAGLAGLLLAPLEFDPVTERNFERIKIGMTAQEVVDNLGEPAEDYPDLMLWHGPGITVDVHFRNGKVTDKGCLPSDNIPNWRIWRRLADENSHPQGMAS
jgi:hypothetical protein